MVKKKADKRESESRVRPGLTGANYRQYGRLRGSTMEDVDDFNLKDDVKQVEDEPKTSILQKAIVNDDDAYANASWLSKLFLSWCTGMCRISVVAFFVIGVG